jgi:putative ABC transport system permease protein
MLLLTLRDLQHRRTRVAVVTLLVTLVLTLLFLMTGLVHQLKTESQKMVDSIGADEWIVAEGVSGPITSVSVLPLSMTEELGSGVQPIVVARGTLITPDGSDTETVIFGHIPGQPGSPNPDTGRAPAGGNEVVVDDTLGLEIGDEISIGGVELEVVGTTSDTTVLAGLPFAFVDLGIAQDIAYDTRERVTAFVGDGADTLPAGSVSLTADEVADDALGPIESAIASIDLIRGLLWAVAAIVVAAVIFLSAIERSRDFAVLKAVGATGRDLGMGLAIQAVIIALLGSIIAAVIATLVEPVFPLAVDVPPSAYWTVPLVAAVVGLVAASFGVRKVSRTDPAAAFGGAA